MNSKIAMEIVEGFKGEYASEYKDTYSYVISGMWEKDYFSAWLEGCCEYPFLEEIKKFCIDTDRIIRLYLEVVENIDTK